MRDFTEEESSNLTDLAGLDLMRFGQRMRHLRRARGLTLADLGERVGRAPSALSLLENGRREPKLSLLNALAGALSVPAGELLSRQPPSRRAQLEIAIEEAQHDPAYAALGLPHLKVGARVPNDVLEHMVALYTELRRQWNKPTATPEEARQANAVPRRRALPGHDPRHRHQTRLHRALRPGPAPLGAVGHRPEAPADLCQAGIDRHAHTADDLAANHRPPRARSRTARRFRRLPAPAGGGQLLRRRGACPRAARRSLPRRGQAGAGGVGGGSAGCLLGL